MTAARGRWIRVTIILAVTGVALLFRAGGALAATNVSSNNPNSWSPRLIVAGATRYLVWQSETGTDDEIYFSKYSGGAWSAPTNVSNNSGASANPQMTTDTAGNLHLVWQDNTASNLDIYHATYNGTSWSAAENVSNDSYRSVNPSIAVDSTGKPYVVWQSETADDTEIYFSKKNGSWSTASNVSNNTGSSSHPQIKADSTNKMHLVWADTSSGNSRIIYRRYSGGAWSSSTPISSDSSDSVFPKIGIDPSNNPVAVWQTENDGKLDIYLASSTAGGNSWASPEKVSSAALAAKHTDIAIAGNGDIHLVWEDHRAGSQGLTYRVKKAGSWRPEVDITFGQYQADSPSIALDQSGNYYLAYSQTTDATRDIFFSDTQYGLTPVGTNQTVQAGENITLLFNSVTANGYSNAILSISPPGSAPAGYRFLDEFYFNISTTAGYTSDVVITVPYDESLIAGSEAGRVRLLRWNGSSWQDITVSQNTTNKTVTGRTSSFSNFAVAEGSPSGDGPGVPTGINQIALLILSLGLLASGSLIIFRYGRLSAGSKEVA